MTFKEFFEEKGYKIVDVTEISYINENGEKVSVPWGICSMEYPVDNENKEELK